MERRLIRPAQAQIQGQTAHGLPFILHIRGMTPPARKPSGKVLGEDRASDRAQQEGGERLPRVWRKGELCTAESVTTRRQRLDRRVVTRAQQFVASLDGVPPYDLRETILKRTVLAYLTRAAERGAQPVADVEDRKRRRRDVGHAQLLSPILSVSQGLEGIGAPVIPYAEIIEPSWSEDKGVGKDAVDVVGRYGLCVQAERAPGQLDLVTSARGTVVGLRIAAKDFMICGELVVNLHVPT